MALDAGQSGHLTDHQNGVYTVSHGATAATARPTLGSESTAPTVVLWSGSVTPSNAVEGDLWWDTTGKTIKRRGASTFGQAAGALHVINESVLSSPAAEVDWTSIPSTYRHLLIFAHGRGSTAANTVFLYAQFNGDTGANYYSQRLYANNTTVGGSTDMGATQAIVGLLTGATATTGHAGSARIELPAYAGTTFNKNGTLQTNYMTATAAANSVHEARGFMWASTAAINRIRLFPSTGNFIAGSTFTLYGLDPVAS